MVRPMFDSTVLAARVRYLTKIRPKREGGRGRHEMAPLCASGSVGALRTVSALAAARAGSFEACFSHEGPRLGSPARAPIRTAACEVKVTCK